ncbi:hypothetical protein ACFQ0D_12350 [Micromonospora zhanjiangensis]
MSVSDSVTHLLANADTPLRQGSVADPDSQLDRLYDLLGRAETPGAMSGPAWGELTEIIAARPHLVPYPPRLWQTLSEQLLNELVLAEGIAWTQRQSAISRLLQHPVGARYAIATCIALAEDQSSAAVIEPLSLLDASGLPAANRYVLQQMEHPSSGRARFGAMLAAVQKVRRGHFLPVELPRLAVIIAESLDDGTVGQAERLLAIEGARTLLRRLSPDARVRLCRRLPALAAAYDRPDVDPATTVASRRVAAQAQALLHEKPGPPDEILSTAIWEAVYGGNPDRRLAAALLLQVSPYREPVGRLLVADLKEGLGTRAGAASASTVFETLTRMGVDSHRPLIREVLTGPGFDAKVRHAAAWATPHCAGRQSAPAWRRILAAQRSTWHRAPGGLGEHTLTGIIYGIGTDGHRDLLTEIRDYSWLPASSRIMAAWMLNHRPPTV